MSKTFKYVKDFDFSSAGKTVGYYGGGAAKRETMAAPVMAKKEVIQRAAVKAPAAPREMLRDTSSLGIKNNKNPGIPRRGLPVAPKQPMIKPYSSGGLMSEKGSKKVERVMSEFKSGELHSGSKTGPVVKNPKQAVAIALSEARNVGKKKK